MVFSLKEKIFTWANLKCFVEILGKIGNFETDLEKKGGNLKVVC